MSPRAIRRLVVVVFLGGIAGMIVGSIKDNNGFAISFGIVTAVAALCLILVTSVAPADALRKRSKDAADAGAATMDTATAADLEDRIAALVDAGADEIEVRQLVRRALQAGHGVPSGT